MIFIHDRADSKLSQVAAYAIGVVGHLCLTGRLVFEQNYRAAP